MRIRFLGANRQVTGSRYLLEAGGLKLLIDCGMFQERAFLDRNWEPPPVPPASIDHVLLTHAHLDHCGLLPRLVAQGYHGPIHTVEPSVALTEIILIDSAHIQEEDTAYKKKRHQREHRRGKHPETSLYTVAQAKRTLPRLRGHPYNQPISLNPHVTVTFHEAGHILGSAFVEVAVTEEKQSRRVVFSGDLGQWHRPLINPPAPLLDQADYVVMESTYGGRHHRDDGSVENQLARIINDTARRRGNLVIPTFAVERAQELIYHIGRLVKADRIPDLPIYLDSPMAVDVTAVFRRYCRYLDPENRCRYGGDVASLRFPGLRLVRRQKDSIAINSVPGPSVIMASSGMCTGGRIKHHLRQNIARPESTILFVGYQAQGTLGRQITDSQPTVRIHGRHWPVRAKIAQLHGLSAHGDHDDLLRWLNGCPHPPRRLFLTHGEEQAARSLAHAVEHTLGWPVSIPSYMQSFDLD